MFIQFYVWIKCFLRLLDMYWTKLGVVLQLLLWLYYVTSLGSGFGDLWKYFAASE